MSRPTTIDEAAVLARTDFWDAETFLRDVTRAVEDVRLTEGEMASALEDLDAPGGVNRSLRNFAVAKRVRELVESSKKARKSADFRGIPS